MNNSNHHTIDHEGIVDQIEGDIARVRILSQSACASCHAKGACSAADQEEKIMEIPFQSISLKIGERVRVMVARRMGLKAVAVGYIYPFLLLMMVLVGLTAAGLDELKAGLVALASLLPYYLGLFIFRHRIGSKFSFSLQKL